MEKLKIIFMGTPVFACNPLKTLIDSKYEVIGVVTQPDKKIGRKQLLTPTPVKELATKYNIPVFQPTKLNKEFDDILELKPDLIVTCAYGQMINDHILHYPKFGSINIHGSLLPKHRGGAPMQRAIMEGDKQTGITIMRMVKKMDAGAYMMQRAIDITEFDTLGTIHDKLSLLGAEMIIPAIEKIVNGTAVFVEQDEDQATYSYNIQKEEELIDSNADVETVFNHIRALIPWPVGYIVIDDVKLKIHEIKKTDIITNLKSGILFSNKKHLYLSCNNGSIEIIKIQKPGKKVVDAISFIAGNKDLLDGDYNG